MKNLVLLTLVVFVLFTSCSEKTLKEQMKTVMATYLDDMFKDEQLELMGDS